MLPKRSVGLAELRVGWRVLVGAAAAMMVSVSGLQHYTVGIFIEPLTRQFGTTRSALGLWSLCLLGGLAIASPLAGWVIDRIGARKVAIFSIAWLAVCVAGLSFINNIASLYAIVLAMALIGGGVSIACSKAVVSWFTSSRGLALGILASGIGLTAMLSPRIVQYVVDEHGWRNGFRFISVVTASALVAVYFFFFERSEAPDSATRMQTPSVTRQAALRMSIFWWITLGFGFFFFVGTAVTVTLVSFLTDSGVSRASAASVLGFFGLGSLAGRLVAGAAFDRLNAPLVCAALFLLSAVAIVVLWRFGPQFATLCVLAIGFSLGAEIDATTYCWSRYFGLKALGEIGGISLTFMMFCSAIGPYVVFRLKELSGGYGLPFGLLTLMATLASVLMMVSSRTPFLDQTVVPVRSDSKRTVRIDE